MEKTVPLLLVLIAFVGGFNGLILTQIWDDKSDLSSHEKLLFHPGTDFRFSDMDKDVEDIKKLAKETNELSKSNSAKIDSLTKEIRAWYMSNGK